MEGGEKGKELTETKREGLWLVYVGTVAIQVKVARLAKSMI